MLIQSRKKLLELSSNDSKISSKNVTFDTFFAMTKMFMKLIFEFKRLLATTTNLRNAIDKRCTSRYEINILIAKRDVTTKYVSLNKQIKF